MRTVLLENSAEFQGNNHEKKLIVTSVKVEFYVTNYNMLITREAIQETIPAIKEHINQMKSTCSKTLNKNPDGCHKPHLSFVSLCKVSN